MFHLRLLLKNMGTTLWIRAAFFSAVAVMTALVSILSRKYIPDAFSGMVGADTVDTILAILASSMLSVTIFSLNAMVSALGSATNNVTPRATKLMFADSITQNMLSTFIGAFIFSLVGIIALKSGLYGQSGEVILFFVTLIIVVLILITLIRWVEHISRLGRVSDTTRLVERTAQDAIAKRAANPSLGANAFHSEDAIPENAYPVYSQAYGYVLHMNLSALNAFAEKKNCDIYINILPGKFLTPGTVVFWSCEELAPTECTELCRQLVIDDERSFIEDPRFCLEVLVEIGSRALSNNDIGTAIDILGRATKTLSLYAHRDPEPVQYDCLWIRPINVSDFFDDVFTPIVRDACHIVEIHMRIQKMLRSLHELDDPDFQENAYNHSQLAWLQARENLKLASERKIIRELVIENLQPERTFLPYASA